MQDIVILDAAGVTEVVGMVGAIPLLARNDVITKDPELTQESVCAWINSVAFIHQDPVDAAGSCRSSSIARAWSPRPRLPGPGNRGGAQRVGRNTQQVIGRLIVKAKSGG
jgi:hypothetical protein